MQKLFKALVFLMLAMNVMVLPALAAEEPAFVVGRVYKIEGELLRYLPDENDWVAVVRDAPFGPGDTLYSGDGAMAELAVPNGSWIRLGDNAQLQVIDLETDLTETDVASGIARFYNKGERSVIKATTPYGYVLAEPGTAFDLYVGEESAEVVAVKGEVSFIHAATGARYYVEAGYESILADQNQVSAGEGSVDPEWEGWNNSREAFWAGKARMRGRSAQYLPAPLHNEAYTLEENGRWERVYYEGSPRWFWRPVTVSAGWSPFTVGRWTDWYGDQTWIPAEPFGYVTHHYGNWVYARNNWYWAPPVATVQIGLPLLNIGFFWNPGRVSWIHSGAYVGWVPLAPRETYYSHRHWGGPHVTVINNINITNINISTRNYAYAGRAIVVRQNNFYGVNNYQNVRVTNITNTTIVNNYRAAPVINKTVINNYETNRQRYNYTNAPVNQKPHSSVIKRIRQNEPTIRRDNGRRENPVVLQQKLQRAPEGKINRESRIPQPRIMSRIVPATEVNRPEAEVRFKQKEIKRRVEGAPEKQPAQVGRPQQQPQQPRQIAPERVQPSKPAQQQRPARTSGQQRVAPQRQEQPTKPAQTNRPQQQPPRPAQVAPESVQPAKPAQQQRPARTREQQQVAPQTQGQPTKPAQINRPQQQPSQPVQVAPESVQPAKPVQQQRPARNRQQQPQQPGQVAPESVQPAKPTPDVAADKVKPAKPVQRERSKEEIEKQKKLTEELETLKKAKEQLEKQETPR
jgi:hypothetical protein